MYSGGLFPSGLCLSVSSTLKYIQFSTAKNWREACVNKWNSTEHTLPRHNFHFHTYLWNCIIWQYSETLKWFFWVQLVFNITFTHLFLGEQCFHPIHLTNGAVFKIITMQNQHKTNYTKGQSNPVQFFSFTYKTDEEHQSNKNIQNPRCTNDGKGMCSL